MWDGLPGLPVNVALYSVPPGSTSPLEADYRTELRSTPGFFECQSHIGEALWFGRKRAPCTDQILTCPDWAGRLAGKVGVLAFRPNGLKINGRQGSGFRGVLMGGQGCRATGRRIPGLCRGRSGPCGGRQTLLGWEHRWRVSRETSDAGITSAQLDIWRLPQDGGTGPITLVDTYADAPAGARRRCRSCLPLPCLVRCLPSHLDTAVLQGARSAINCYTQGFAMEPTVRTDPNPRCTRSAQNWPPQRRRCSFT